MNNEGRMNALRYIYKEKSGYMDTLIKCVTKNYVEELISAGFIICGYTSQAKTWRISQLGRDFYQEIC